MTTTIPGKYLATLAERTAASFVEAFASAWMVADAYNLSTAETAALAGVMAALTVLRAALTSFLGHRAADPTIRTGYAYAVDVFERVAATFAEAGIAALLLAGTLDLSHARAAGFAGLTAALSVLKALLARFVGSTATASLLPAAKDPGTPPGSRPA
ncbi:hypothetical protein B4N89_27955 [Embleya scabrispora]|uniref:Holin n=1 Tax=Embleya scabrispora TaxID=159449 RepID=A0A1T3P5B4_9ACTN|nr:hypothetical protein [Embleya scabrispora]OPC84253.1 hypothetical protein B4N89_27955 [Embleya scabrispora]